MSRGTWARLSQTGSGQPILLNLEQATAIYSIQRPDGGVGAVVVFAETNTQCVNESPGQIMAAVTRGAVYPAESLPGSIFPCPPPPASA